LTKIPIKFSIQQPEKALQDLVQSGRKAVSMFELPEKLQSGKKSPVKPTWSEKITVLSTFLESLLKFPFNNLGNTSKFGTVREKSGVKV